MMMHHASNTSGTTHTTMTTLDNASIGSASFFVNGISRGISEETDHGVGCISRTTTPSLISLASSSVLSSNSTTPTLRNGGVQIFNYRLGNFIEYDYASVANCEEVCISFCRQLNILPTTRLLFGLRVYDSEEWAVPGNPLRSGVRYCFRMRFKVPALDKRVLALDPEAYEYLYRQMRYDMVRECIPEIRYPAKKDNVLGLGVLDMYIDCVERRDTVERIESDFKRYLPRKLVKAHKVFVKPKICSSFRQFRTKNIDIKRVKWNYVHEVHNLAPNYLLENYVAIVDYIPDEEQIAPVATGESGDSGLGGAIEERVCVKLDLYDTPEPGLKISRKLAEENLKWILVSKLENIYALYIEGSKFVRLEITGFNNGYRMQFDTKIQLESFITYLSGYIRLTSKWMLGLCVQYMAPSLQELKTLRCHGPIGGNFSFTKIREKRDKCGSYIVRQCEKEYDTYYIDINTKSLRDKCKTETFKITKDISNIIIHNTSNHPDATTTRTKIKWILHYNDDLVSFDKLTDLAHYIPTESTEPKFCLPPSEKDKPSSLLICLPKKLQSKKTETELSDAELQRKPPQILNPKIDFQWYKNSACPCDNGKMTKFRADWLQQGSFKDVCVTLKVLENNSEFSEFMKLADTWSKICSPHFIKLFGLTISTPYTMVMEHAKYGPLNEFLVHNKKVTIRSLLGVTHGLVRGIVYLQEYGIIHGYIRCSNLYVTKFDPKTHLLEAKISDPGFPRPYTKDELPWIPFEYYKYMNAAKDDQNAELWAFATTVWEIFARGKPIKNATADVLRFNYNRFGGILPQSNDCPDDIYKIIMDGWCDEPDKRFNHQEIFAHLITVKEELEPEENTHTLNAGPTETLSDTSSLHSQYSNAIMEDGSDLINGHNGDEISSTSSVGDRAPLIRSSQQLAQHDQHNMGTFSHRNYLDDTPSVLLVPNGKIIYKNKIGEGHYGTVYLGEIRYNSHSRPNEQVAIKTLKSVTQTQLNKDFMREIQIMETLDHPNIVKIKQWVENPISIIMEYLECGSFIVYLSSRKPNLTNEKLLGFAFDIAKGMDYLRSQQVIHRDLAARNILVDGDRVKISDFGLAQMANQDGYYFAQSEREIPIKWYSPESMTTHKFSFQSDVWSYGVTLFEMFSRGETPNIDPERELKQDELLKRLDNGDRLRKPMLCPDNVYEKLMLPCWAANPKMRPSFKDLIDEIQSITNETTTTAT